MKFFILIASLLLVGCGTTDLQQKIDYTVDLWCPAMGAPQGSEMYPVCYSAVTETSIDFPASNPDEALKKAKEVCSEIKKNKDSCIATALDAAVKAQQASADISSKRRQACRR